MNHPTLVITHMNGHVTTLAIDGQQIIEWETHEFGLFVSQLSGFITFPWKTIKSYEVVIPIEDPIAVLENYCIQLYYKEYNDSLHARQLAQHLIDAADWVDNT